MKLVIKSPLRCLAAACALTAFQSSDAAEDFVAECDRLAGETSGVIAASVAESAKTACESAVARHPDIPRLLHQYARALEQLGDTDTALRLYEWAAADQYGPARDRLARLKTGTPSELLAAGGGAPRISALARKATSLGNDPAAHLAWVAANISPDGYAGALRGAHGTLFASAGSAADKALLLKAMIETVDPGANFRFAQCRLPEAQSNELVAALHETKPARLEPLIELANEFAGEIRNPETRRVVEALAAKWREAVATVARQSGEISTSLRAGGLQPNAPVVDAGVLRDALAQHVWLQLQHEGTWIDLDPTLRNPTGRARCAVESTTEDLPESSLHKIRIELVAEERDGDALVRRPLLDHILSLPDLEFANITVLFADGSADGLAAVGAAAQGGSARYTPILRFATTELVGDAVVLPRPRSAPAGLGGLLDVFDSPAVPAAASPPLDNDGVAAVWLQISTIAPGDTRETVSVPLFDRIGYAARAGNSATTAPLAPLAETDGEYAALASVWNVAVWNGAAQSGDTLAPDAAGDDAVVSGLRALHAGYGPLRLALYESAVADAPRLLWNRAGVSLLGWVPNGGTNGAGADFVMDVLLDPARALSDAGAQASFAWTVSSVLSERFVAGLDRTFAPLLDDAPAVELVNRDVVAVFETARDQQTGVAWLAPGNEDGLPVGASAEAAARIRAHLANGRGVVVPRRPVTLGDEPALGWWFFDPKTNLLRDEFENGRHQGMVEHAATTQPSRQAAPVYRRTVTQRIVCNVNRAIGIITIVLGAINGDLDAVSAGKSAFEFEAKVAEAIDKAKKAGGSVKGPQGPGCGP